MELLKCTKPVGRAERGVTQQNKVQLRKIEINALKQYLNDDKGETKSL